MSLEIIKNIEEKILSLNTIDLIKYILENHKNIAFSTSLGAEDQVITDMIYKVDKKTNTFHVYRNYFAFNIISKTNGSSANVEGDFFGLWSDADFFPSLVNSPKDFTHKDEFLFWGNISHNFKKK